MAKMTVPENGVTVRMYRQGHGDCFLLGFPREEGDTPYYVLIDCGYKPGSQRFPPKNPIQKIVDDIGETTGKKLDLVIVTHEHQDHVNGFWKKTNPYFGEFAMEEAWFAWTEDATDDLANELRRRHRDQLLGLAEARRHLVALGVGEDSPALHGLDALLSMEMGGEEEGVAHDALLAAADPSKSQNKQSMKLIKDKVAGRRGVRFLSPGGKPRALIGTAGVRAFVLGPPRSADLLTDEDPVGEENFSREDGGHHGLSFIGAAAASEGERQAPFSAQSRILKDEALAEKSPPAAGFFTRHYGIGVSPKETADKAEAPDGASWRRIDGDWLFSAGNLALKLNAGVNNTSLVLAFELPKTKKVLLFVGDAQRGNWVSWADVEFQDGDDEITVRDLLGRTVLYKVGHHCSHNATLNGTVEDGHPNLSWMGREGFSGEFTAMITAVNEWALTKNSPPWRHPLPSIKAALVAKAQGRVFQTDVDEPPRPDDVSEATWKAFLKRVELDKLYFDLTIQDA